MKILSVSSFLSLLSSEHSETHRGPGVGLGQRQPSAGDAATDKRERSVGSKQSVEVERPASEDGTAEELIFRQDKRKVWSRVSASGRVAAVGAYGTGLGTNKRRRQETGVEHRLGHAVSNCLCGK